QRDVDQRGHVDLADDPDIGLARACAHAASSAPSASRGAGAWRSVATLPLAARAAGRRPVSAPESSSAMRSWRAWFSATVSITATRRTKWLYIITAGTA